MGDEFTGFSLLDVYAKTNPNKITQKFGDELIITVNCKQGENVKLKRTVTKNP